MNKSAGTIEDVITQLSHLDLTVEEVFNTMVGIPCTVDADASGLNHTINAVIGFAGALRGTCIVKVNDDGALRLATALTGMPVADVDDLVTDAMGEMCNILAGAWKGRFTELSSACMLSVPMVTTGKEYKLHIPATSVAINRNYKFENHIMTVSILGEV